MEYFSHLVLRIFPLPLKNYVRNLGQNITAKFTMHDLLSLFFTYKYKYIYHYDALELVMGLRYLDMVGVGNSGLSPQRKFLGIQRHD